MNALVVYYSLTGKTRSVATALAKALGADVEEIRCSRYFPSFLGFIRAGYDSWRGKLPLIEPSAHAPQHYDVVVVGAPIWAWHVATPVRAYLREERSKLPRVGFFLTHGGSGSEPAFREMKTLAGRAPIATLVVREKDVKEGNFGAAITSFAATMPKNKAV